MLIGHYAPALLLHRFVDPAVGALRRGAGRPAPQHRGEALVIGLAVASHFLLDLVVHVPDLPVIGTMGTKWGLGLWRHRGLALMVECGLFVLAACVWVRPRENRHPGASVVLGAMTALLVASFYIPPPPTPGAMAISGLATYAACAFAAWWGLTPASASAGPPARWRPAKRAPEARA